MTGQPFPRCSGAAIHFSWSSPCTHRLSSFQGTSLLPLGCSHPQSEEATCLGTGWTLTYTNSTSSDHNAFSSKCDYRVHKQLYRIKASNTLTKQMSSKVILRRPPLVSEDSPSHIEPARIAHMWENIYSCVGVELKNNHTKMRERLL